MPQPAPSPDSGAGRDLFRLLLLTALLIGAGLGLRAPWPADEPRFALVAQHMAVSGNWLFPSIGGDLYADKPPLFFWLMAVCLKLTGSLRIAFLLPALLSALGIVALVHDLVRRLHGRVAALCAAGTLAATLQFVTVMRGAQIDPLLCFLTTLSLYALLRHLLLGPAWGWYFLGAFAAGLGVITKGVGFLPLLVLIPYALLRARFWKAGAWQGLAGVRSAWRWAVLGLGGLLLAVALWLVPMLVAVQLTGNADFAAYRDEILFRQTVTRYARAWIHVEPWYYFIVSVIPGLWLPWTPLLFWLVPRWQQDWSARRAATWLPLLWLALVLAFFSASTGKRGLYIFPALPALALAAAPWLPQLYARPAVRRVGLILAAVLALVAVAVAVLYLTGLTRLAQLARDNQISQPLPLILIAFTAVVAWLLAWRRAPLLAWPGVLLALVLGWALLLMPDMDGLRSGRSFTQLLMRSVPPGQPLGLVAYKEQFLLYIDRPVTNFGHSRSAEGPQSSRQEEADAARWLNAAAGRRLLIPAIRARACFADTHQVPLGESGGRDWLLVDGQASAECAGRGQERTYVANPE
ncbi:MAG: glycosyltransferase family 39 protein [Steroidobacteraceae bacterium]